METMDALNPALTQLFAAKEARRHRLAALSFPEKVRAVVRLQEMAAPILRARGRQVQPWQLARPTDTPLLDAELADFAANPNAGSSWTEVQARLNR